MNVKVGRVVVMAAAASWVLVAARETNESLPTPSGTQGQRKQQGDVKKSPNLRPVVRVSGDFNIQDENGDTQLMKWVREGRENVLISVLSQCPDLTLTNKKGQTVLQVAEKEGRLVAEDAIKKKLARMCEFSGRQYPLHHTRYEECVEVVCGARCEWEYTGAGDPTCRGRLLAVRNARRSISFTDTRSRIAISASPMLDLEVHQVFTKNDCL